MGFARMLPAALAAVALIGCGGGHERAETAVVDTAAMARDSAARAARSGEQRIANVMIGKRLGAENRIAEPTFQFDPPDTVYISAEIQGAPKEGTLSAKWVAQGNKIMDSTTQQIASGDTARKEFHLSPAKGWKPGTYMIKLFLNGDSVQAKTFAVRK
ncbi:MAG: hypothetical protein ACTHM9_10110 [Gemmatimonadales bacterium]